MKLYFVAIIGCMILVLFIHVYCNTYTSINGVGKERPVEGDIPQLFPNCKVRLV